MALGNKTLNDLLDPISKQLEHDGVAESVAMPTWEFKAQRLTDGLSHDQLVDMFVDEAAKIRVIAHRCKQDDLVKCIGDIVAAGTPDSGEECSVVCADDERFASAGLAAALKRRKRVTGVHVWDEALGQANVNAAFTATYGITYASAGIAESATVGHLIRQFADLDVLEVYFVAVILQEDMTFGGVPEVGPVAVLAVGHEGVPLLVVAAVLQDLDSVEPVLYVVTHDDDECVVIDTHVERLLLGRWNEVIE